MNVGQRMKDFRMKNDKTLVFLSEKTGISVSFLSDMETGRTNPSLETIQKICNFWGVTLSKFFEGVTIKAKQKELTEEDKEEILKEYESCDCENCNSMLLPHES